MARRARPALKILPNSTGNNKIPKPRVKTEIGAPFSARAMKAQTPISVPGVKTN